MILSEWLFLLTCSSQFVGEFIEREEFTVLIFWIIDKVLDVESFCALKTSLRTEAADLLR